VAVYVYVLCLSACIHTVPVHVYNFNDEKMICKCDFFNTNEPVPHNPITKIECTEKKQCILNSIAGPEPDPVLQGAA
jgi:hypothetical protein